MELRDRILDHTGSFVAGWAAWVPLSILILTLVRWMIAGDIDVLIGMAGIAVGLLLGFIALAPTDPAYSFIILFVLSGTVALFPLVRAGFNKKALRSIDVEALERAYSALSLRPDNVAAKFKIARLAYEMGFPGHALRIAESCLQSAPQRFFQEEHQIVNRWRYVRLPATAFAPLPCVECGQSNPPGNLHCASCGAPFLLLRAKGKVLPGNLGKRLMIAWIAMMGALAGCPPLLKSGGTAGKAGAFALMIVAVSLLILAFRKDEDGRP